MKGAGVRIPPAPGRLPGRTIRRAAAFTLIELMVVVAIVVMAMGVMAPTLMEFFRNQKLKSVRSHFGSAFNIARLMAITEGTAVRVVFFKEGVRVYNVSKKAFRADEEFSAESAPCFDPKVTYDLRFTKKKNADLPPYRQWEATQPHIREVPGMPGASPQAGQCDVKDLIAIEFQRDGTVLWIPGDDINTRLYKQDPPTDADIIARQVGNAEALFIDIRNTGPIQTRFAPLPEGDEESES